MLEREKQGEDRKTAKSQIESRIESVEGSEEEDGEEKLEYVPPEEKHPDLDHPTADKQWVERLEDAEYRIIELSEEDYREHETGTEAECPELEQFTEDELENFCIHREEDDHCNALGQPCVLQDDD
jgi:hypothetical protein